MTGTVGLIGVGAMGQALLARLRKADLQVRAYDVAEAAMRAAQSGGAEPVESAAAAARGARFVHVFVRSDAEVVEAVLGTDGALAGAAPGTIILLHSTILPTTTRHIAQMAAQRQVGVLDVPITAVPAKVLQGEGAFLVGGPEDLVEVVRPHLLALEKKVYHFGPLGSGNVAKLIKNLTNGAERVVLAQAVMLAEAGGIEPRRILDVLKAEDSGSIVRNWERAFTIENGRATLNGGANIFNKDLPLAAELAKRYALDLGVIREAAEAGLRYTGATPDPVPAFPES